MNSQPAQRQWFEDTAAKNSGSVPEIDLPWLNKTRSDARRAISRLALPERRLEAWRYTNLDSLYKQQYRDAETATLGDIDIDQCVYTGDESHRLVFVNGRFVPDMSSQHALQDDVRIGSLREIMSAEPALITRWLAHNAWFAPDVFTELNRVLINDGVFIYVAENTTLDKPVEAVYLNTSLQQPSLSQPHSLIILEPGAQAKIIERFTGKAGSAYFFNGITQLSLGANAGLQHIRLQQESSNAHHLNRLALRQDEASEYNGISVATGASWSRTDIKARFDGMHAVCNLDGLYTVGEQQYTDFHLDVRHNLPNCRSREDFKGIVYGKGRAVFDGRIRVEKDAQKTDAQLTNKNLLLTRMAEVDTKPQLEILADDVKCSHGTTVGKLDPNQLFYLRSRGIDEHQARKMICLGFAEQVLAHVDEEPVKEFVKTQISGIFDRQDVLS